MNKVFIFAILAFLPSVSFSYSLEATPSPGATIIDSGEIACYASMKWERGGYRRGNEVYGGRTDVYCRSSFGSTKVKINKIELKNIAPAMTANVRVEVNDFPFGTDAINASQAKIFNLTSTINPNTQNVSALQYFTTGNETVEPVKIYLDVLGTEKTTTYSNSGTPGNPSNEYVQNEQLQLFVVDAPAVPKTLTDEDCWANHGYNSVVNGNSCTCKDNYMFNVSNQCVPAGQECVLRYGDKSIPSSVISCGCANGYHMDVAAQKCVEDAKPVMTISANVKKWVDDNYWKGDVSCSSNLSFSASELKICDLYNNSFTRQKYEWRVEQLTTMTPPVIPPPSVEVATKSSTIVAPISKPVVTNLAQKQREILVAKATTTIQFEPISTTTQQALVEQKPPSQPTPTKPKSFWAKLVGWFKFW